MENMIYFLPVYLLAGYLLGSIPFGLVLCKVAGYGDIRKIGSGNIGATNVLRTGNKFLALMTLLLDSGKGAIAVLIAIFSIKYFGNIGYYRDYVVAIAGLGAVLGHIFPVWLGFKGGKGVATTLGTLLAVSPMTGVVSCLTWLIVAVLSRISSLSALVAMIVAPVVAYFYSGWIVGVIIGCIAIVVWVRHKENIKRIMNGTEPRIGKKKNEIEDKQTSNG